MYKKQANKFNKNKYNKKIESKPVNNNPRIPVTWPGTNSSSLMWVNTKQQIS